MATASVKTAARVGEVTAEKSIATAPTTRNWTPCRATASRKARPIGSQVPGVDGQDDGEEPGHDGQVEKQHGSEPQVPAEQVAGAGDGLRQDGVQDPALHVPGDQVGADENRHEHADELHGGEAEVGEDPVPSPSVRPADEMAGADQHRRRKRAG